VKSTEKRPLQILLIIYRSLIIFLLLLGVVLILGTIYASLLRKNPSGSLRTSTSQKVAAEGQTFTGLGPVRVSTADPQPGMAILVVSFMFYPTDRAFSEELTLRVKDLRQIIREYLGSFSVSELRTLSEDILKTELLNRFNNILRLGQIENLYFSEFMVVE